jgi:hypothetical protein
VCLIRLAKPQKRRPLPDPGWSAIGKRRRSKCIGRTMAQVVSRQPANMKARVTPCRTCGQSDAGADSSPSS